MPETPTQGAGSGEPTDDFLNAFDAFEVDSYDLGDGDGDDDLGDEGPSYIDPGIRGTRPLTLNDLLDLDGVLDATKGHYEKETTGIRPYRGDIDNLCLNRESNPNDYDELAGLIDQLAGLHPNIPGIADIAALGALPLLTDAKTIEFQSTDPDTGETVTATVRLKRLQVEKATGVLFIHKRTAYLYSMSSAARVNEMGHQDWTRLLIRVVAYLRPTNIRAVNVSRYTRSLEVAGLLLHSLSRHVETVWAGSLELSMHGTRSAMDKLLFTMLAMGAALERDSIVSRTAGGTVVAAKRNVWLPGRRAQPPGYNFIPETQKLVPDESQRDQVQAVLRLIVERPTPAEFKRRARHLNINLRRQGPEGFNTPGRGSNQLATLLSYVSLWAVGKKVVKLPNPFPGVTKIGDIPVVRGPNGREEVHIISTFGVPEGGWADQALLDAAVIAARDLSNGRRSLISDELLATLDPDEAAAIAAVPTSTEMNRPGKQKAPHATLWAGTNWTDSTYEWTLRGKGVHAVVLARTPLSASPGPTSNAPTALPAPQPPALDQAPGPIETGFTYDDLIVGFADLPNDATPSTTPQADAEGDDL